MIFKIFFSSKTEQQICRCKTYRNQVHFRFCLSFQANDFFSFFLLYILGLLFDDSPNIRSFVCLPIMALSSLQLINSVLWLTWPDVFCGLKHYKMPLAFPWSLTCCMGNCSANLSTYFSKNSFKCFVLRTSSRISPGNLQHRCFLLLEFSQKVLESRDHLECKALLVEKFPTRAVPD